jgi:MFS family permease
MSLAARLAHRRIHYGWIVAAVTFLVLLSSAGVRATPSILIVPLEREFGWTRATISLAVSINLILYGLMGPFAATLMQRLGVRTTVLISAATLTVGVALTPLMRAPWQLILLWGVVVGAGTGMTALVLGATVVNRWFTARRGLVMGILTASTATGQLVFLPLLAAMVERHGWRTATLLVAGAVLLIIPLVLLLLRERPEDVGLARFGEQGLPGREKGGTPVSTSAGALAALRQGARSRDFWLLAGSFFICGASTNGLIGTHLIPACIDQGISEVRAAGLLATMGVFDFIGTTGSGWLSDRWNNRYLLSWYY